MMAGQETDSTQYYFEKAKSFENNSYDSMRHYALRIKRLADEGNTSARVRYEGLLGVMLEMQGQYDSAVYHLKRAHMLAQKDGDTAQSALAQMHLGVVYKDLAEFDSALDHFFNALRESESIGSSYTTAMANLNIGQVYSQLGKLAEARDFSTRAINIAREINNQRVVAAALLERANYLIMTGDLDGSFDDLRKAESIFRATNQRDGLPSVLNSMGAIQFYKGDFKEAIAFYKLSKQEAELSEDPLLIGNALQNIGEAYIYLKDYRRSREYLEESLSQFKGLGNKQFIASNYQYLIDLEQARGDYRSALHFYQLKDVYEDSILNEQNQAVMANLAIQYETEKKEQEVAMLKSEAEIRGLELSQTRNLVIFIAVLSLLLVVALILFTSRQRFKLKAELANEREKRQKARIRAVIDGEEQERKRIAQDLHDGLGQLLSTARMTVSSLDDEQENERIQNSIQLIDTAVQEVRTISHNLMPNALVSVGLDAALRDLVRRVNESGKLVINFDPKVSLNLAESNAIALYRVVQEVLNNAIKYAEATEIAFEVSGNGQGFTLNIRDNGKGFDTTMIDKSEGIGWANIRSRVEMTGGTISVFSELNEGTSVNINIPDERANQSIAG